MSAAPSPRVPKGHSNSNGWTVVATRNRPGTKKKGEKIVRNGFETQAVLLDSVEIVDVGDAGALRLIPSKAFQSKQTENLERVVAQRDEAVANLANCEAARVAAWDEYHKTHDLLLKERQSHNETVLYLNQVKGWSWFWALYGLAVTAGLIFLAVQR
jgi:hypothetical protein